MRAGSARPNGMRGIPPSLWPSALLESIQSSRAERASAPSARKGSEISPTSTAGASARRAESETIPKRRVRASPSVARTAVSVARRAEWETLPRRRARSSVGGAQSRVGDGAGVAAGAAVSPVSEEKGSGDLHAAGAHARIGVREAPQEEESAVSVVELDDSVQLVHVEVQEPAARLGVVILEDDEWQRPGLVVLPKCDDQVRGGNQSAPFLAHAATVQAIRGT